MKKQKNNRPFVLGVDLGAESIGWAILLSKDGQPGSIEAAGTHCFDAAVEGDLETGRDESRAKARRDARMPRRQHWRRAWRRRKLLRLLLRHGFMPPGPIDSPQSIHNLLLSLDAVLRKKHDTSGDRINSHLLP